MVKKKETCRRLDRLLSQSSELSVTEKELVWKGIRSRIEVDPPKVLKPRRRVVWISAAAAACFVMVLAGVFVFLNRADRFFPDGALGVQVRGDGSASGYFFTLCVPDIQPSTDKNEVSGEACRPGDTLVFDLRPPYGARYFSAAALGPDGLLVWFYPSQTRKSLDLAREDGSGLGVVLDPLQPPGRYEIFGFFSSHPLEQEEIRATIEKTLSGQTVDIEMSKRSLKVVSE